MYPVSRWVLLLGSLAGLLLFLSAEPAPVSTSGTRADTTDVFMWTGAKNFLPEDSLLFQTKLAFAARQGIIPYESGIHEPDDLRRFLRACRHAGIERTWIEIGPNDGVSAKAFATDSSARAATLRRFRRLARTYEAHAPRRARITIFDEAPLGAFDPLPGTGYSERVDAFRTYGPTAFVQMYRALKKEAPKAEVGVFLHHPHNASRKMAGSHTVIDSFMAATESMGATPDFIYSDVYRGYFNRGYGVEATNDYITDVVAHTKTVARQYGAEAHHLGQTHTIKLGYTPSRWEIDTNVRAMLDGAPDGVGWYWPNYASTNRTKGPNGAPAQPEGYDVSFDPFIPNSWGKTGPAGSLFATSRDRFVYAYLRLQEATERLTADHRFDLWLYGKDFDHVEHSLYARASGDSSWTFVGAITPQRDRDAYVKQARSEYVYSYNERWHAVVFHGLERTHLLNQRKRGGRLQVKVTTHEGSDASLLAAAYALPYRATRHYVTETKATALIQNQPRWMGVNSLAHHVRPVADTLRPNTSATYTLSTDAPLDSTRIRRWQPRISR